MAARQLRPPRRPVRGLRRSTRRRGRASCCSRATQTAIKLLHGRAFRAPNAYELYYYAPLEGGVPLDPEEIRSTEIVWEESLSKHVRTAVTAFAYDADQIIDTAARRRRRSRRYLLRERGRHPWYRDRSRSGDQVPERHCRALQPDLRAGARTRSPARRCPTRRVTCRSLACRFPCHACSCRSKVSTSANG